MSDGLLFLLMVVYILGCVLFASAALSSYLDEPESFHGRYVFLILLSVMSWPIHVLVEVLMFLFLPLQTKRRK